MDLQGKIIRKRKTSITLNILSFKIIYLFKYVLTSQSQFEEKSE